MKHCPACQRVYTDEMGFCLEDGSALAGASSAVSGHPLLQPAAVRAANGARFSPTQLSGQPVKVTGVITYNFIAQEMKRVAFFSYNRRQK
jgi:hypothetical protein